VTDVDGLASEPETTTVVVSNVAPSVSLALGADSVLVGENVSVTASFTDPGAADAPWQWNLDWGNGTEATGSAAAVSSVIDPGRTYDSAGTYTVRLSVTDSDGGTGAAERTLVVSRPPSLS